MRTSTHTALKQQDATL